MITKYTASLSWLILVIGLSACASLAEKPNNTTAFTSDQIVAMARQVERAQASGALSEEKGDEYLGLLLKANELLSGSADTYAGISACETSTSKFQCIDSILATIEGGLQ